MLLAARERISQEDFGMKPTTAKARMCNDCYQLNTQLVWWLYMNFIRALIDESSQAHPSKDFLFTESNADPSHWYQVHHDGNEADYCQAFERWHRECLGKGLESSKIFCVIYFSKKCVKKRKKENKAQKSNDRARVFEPFLW